LQPLKKGIWRNASRAEAMDEIAAGTRIGGMAEQGPDLRASLEA
jgi:hypothetical protein